MKDLTKAEIRILTRDSNKQLLEGYIDNERNMTRINQLETYAGTVTKAGDLLKRMAENAFMDRDYGHLSDSDLDYLIDDQGGRMYDIVSTLENALKAIKEGTYRRLDSPPEEKIQKNKLIDVNQLETYDSTVTQTEDLLKRMADDAFVDRDHGNLSDSDLDYLIGDQCERMYSIVATLEDTLRAIKAGTYRGRSDGNIIYPTSYEE